MTAMTQKRDDGYSLGPAASARVAERLKALMEERKVTQLALGKKTERKGVPQGHISDLLRGRRRFQRWQILALAEALGASERDLAPAEVLAIPEELTPRLAPVRAAEELPPGLAHYLEGRESRIAPDVVEHLKRSHFWTEGVTLDDAFWDEQRRIWERRLALPSLPSVDRDPGTGGGEPSKKG